MAEQEQSQSATVPRQPQAEAPLKKGLPLVIGLIAAVLLFGVSNALNLISGHKKDAAKSALPERPATANAQQVSSFENQQAIEAKRDAAERLRNRQSDQQQADQEGAVPGPEADGAAPMTPAQRAAIYGNSPNAPSQTSGASEARAEARQRALLREKLRQDAIGSDTVAIDFARSGAAAPAAAIPPDYAPSGSLPTGQRSGTELASETAAAQPGTATTDATLGRYDFDAYQGRLYRVFEGTVFEGVVTNHIDGGFNGPVLIMLTTDYYSHDHQQLLLPQGTRLIGTVQSVASGQQRKLFVVFHRAVCPDGFSLDIDKYIGLDPLGTTGLATNVNHGYFSAFAAAAAIGGLGGLTQIGNNGSILTPSTEIRNGISQQSGQEAEQVLNRFLSRLPVITLKEGARARVYIGRDILIPAYAEHRVDPSL